MSESENNRIKRNSGNLFKGFDRKRKRSNGLEDAERKKLLSNYLPQNKKQNEEGTEPKTAKPGLDFSQIFNKNVKKVAPNIQENTEVEKKGVETFLDEYEKLRMEYEQDGMSQSSILLLQRMASSINTNPQYPNIDQTPVLKELLDISKKLMLNDFEVIVWMIWLKLVELPGEEDRVTDFLQIIALFVKQSNNPEGLFAVYEQFYSHNYPNFFARFRNSQRPDIHLTSMEINHYYREITKNFDYKKEKAIKDYNYEVDALEAEHDKREVHTTTKFEEEKLKLMEEEARKSNALLNYGKRKPKTKEEKTTPTNKRTRKMADKELEQIKEDIEGTNKQPAIKVFPNEGGIKIEKVKPPGGFRPPSFSNKGMEQGGFIPANGSLDKLPSLNPAMMPSSSLLAGTGSKQGGAYMDLFHGTSLGGDDFKDKNGNLKYMQVYIGGNSNQNSMDMPSFNFNPEGLKNPKVIKVSPNASFQSNLPNFSKDNSRNFLANNKSGSIDNKFGFMGAPGGSFNLNTSNFPQDNQK